MRKRSKMDSKNPFRVAWPKLQQIAWKSARKMAINRVSEATPPMHTFSRYIITFACMDLGKYSAISDDY
jgi:hypothetical protein